MKFIADLLQSVSGNTKTKIEDPIVGAFIGSWVLCNWSYLTLLFWGDGTVTERVSIFSRYLKETEFFAFNSLFVIPLIMALAFLFVLPWLSLLLKSIQKFANNHLHQQAVSIEIDRIEQQESLNKKRLLANPDKRFLEQNVQLDIDRRKEIIEQLKLRTTKRQAVALEAEAASQVAAEALKEAKSRANQVQLEEEKKQQHAAIERQRFALESSRLKSAQASNRFPSAYNFMQELEDDLKADNVHLSLAGLGGIVAEVFGYNDFQSLIFDEEFNNSKLSQVKYIYYEPKELAAGLEEIAHNEKGHNEGISSDQLFDCVISTFERLDYTLITEDQAEELCRDFCEDNRHEVLMGDSLSGPMAESDTIYEEVDIGDLDSISFNDGLKVVFSGTASGTHRRENDVGGRDIEFRMEVYSAVLLGTRGLGELEIGEITGGLADYYSED